MRIIFPLLICVLEELSSLNFAFNHNELVITMVFNKGKVRSISPDPICARENCIILLNSWV